MVLKITVLDNVMQLFLQAHYKVNSFNIIMISKFKPCMFYNKKRKKREEKMKIKKKINKKNIRLI